MRPRASASVLAGLICMQGVVGSSPIVSTQRDQDFCPFEGLRRTFVWRQSTKIPPSQSVPVRSAASLASHERQAGFASSAAAYAQSGKQSWVATLTAGSSNNVAMTSTTLSGNMLGLIVKSDLLWRRPPASMSTEVECGGAEGVDGRTTMSRTPRPTWRPDTIEDKGGTGGYSR
jgi:hypothetical protein